MNLPAVTGINDALCFTYPRVFVLFRVDALFFAGFFLAAAFLAARLSASTNSLATFCGMPAFSANAGLWAAASMKRCRCADFDGMVNLVVDSPTNAEYLDFVPRKGPASAFVKMISWRQLVAIKFVSGRNIEVQCIQRRTTCIDDLVTISALYQDQ